VVKEGGHRVLKAKYREEGQRRKLRGGGVREGEKRRRHAVDNQWQTWITGKSVSIKAVPSGSPGNTGGEGADGKG